MVLEAGEPRGYSRLTRAGWLTAPVEAATIGLCPRLLFNSTTIKQARYVFQMRLVYGVCHHILRARCPPQNTLRFPPPTDPRTKP